MTQHPPRSLTLNNELEDLEQELNWKLKILDFATLVLSHPSMTHAIKEMATKDLGTVTKRTTTPVNPAMPGTSASSTDTHGLHASIGMPITDSQKDLLMSLMTSLQLPITGSSQSTPPTSTNTTLSTGTAYSRPSRTIKKNWHDSQREKAIQRRKKEKEQFKKTSKSPESKHLDLRVARALDEIFGTLLAETGTNTETSSKLKME